MTAVEMHNWQTQIFGTPSPQPGVRAFAVADELVIVAPRPETWDDTPNISTSGDDHHIAFSVNSSARIIWELCDGERSPQDIVDVLSTQFDVARDVLDHEVSRSLTHFSRAGILGGLYEHDRTKTPVTFVTAIEDQPAYWWQTAILLESFKDQLPNGWSNHVVVCNGGEPLSKRLHRILKCYRVNYSTAERLDNSFQNGIDFAALGATRVALKAAALRTLSKQVAPDEMICLIDSDMFLFGGLPVGLIPTECAVMKLPGSAECGLKFDKLAEALGIDGVFAAGAGTVFLSGTVATNKKFVDDCCRLARTTADLAAMVQEDATLHDELPSFALAMAANDIAYEDLEHHALSGLNDDREAIAAGTLYKYGVYGGAGGRTAFVNSHWNSHAYRDRDFLKSDFEPFAQSATSEHEQFFFKLARDARSRLNV